MKRTVLLTCLFALLAGSAFAADQFSAVLTLTCKGSKNRQQGPCPNGGGASSLTLGTDGNFYGTAKYSVESQFNPTGGTVFSLTSSGTFKLLHTFSNSAQGQFPNQVIEGPDGKIYGTTLSGGNSCLGAGETCGVLFRVNTDGSGFQVLHAFCSQTNCTDGSSTYVGLIVSGDGNLYGVTWSGGSEDFGTVFRVTPSTGAYQVVASFDSATTGYNPLGLIVGSDGNLYGISFGVTVVEMLFHYSPTDGTLTAVPLNFPLFDTFFPSSGSLLTLGPNGNFYGIYGIYAMEGNGVFEVQPDGNNLQLFPFYATVNQTATSMLLASDSNFWVTNLYASNGYGSITTLSSTDGSLIQTLTPFSRTAAVGGYPYGLLQDSKGVLWGPTFLDGHAPKGSFGAGAVFSLNAGLPPR